MSSEKPIVGQYISLLSDFGFKRIFGDSLRSPIDLGVFMAALGLQIFVVVGSIMWSLISSRVYKLNLHALPYDLLLGTALSSLFFNFVIKFGLSISSPVVVALATQLGIPLNLQHMVRKRYTKNQLIFGKFRFGAGCFFNYQL